MNVHLMGCDGKEGARTEGADVQHTAHPPPGKWDLAGNKVCKSEEKEESLGEQVGIVLCEATDSRHRRLRVLGKAVRSHSAME